MAATGTKMLALIESKRTEIARICRHRGVRTLEVFGSAVCNDFDAATSDIDFVVEFEADDPRPALESYFGLKADLEVLFGRPVDLVMPNAVRNPYVRAEIECDRRPLYAA